MTTYNINEELNGIEIKFDEKPLSSTLTTLKEAGFRWHNLKKLWYAKQTEERLNLAKLLTTTENYAAKIREEEPIIWAGSKTTTKTKTKEKEEKPKVNKYGVQVGDIFCASWGYEQTNNDFFQVIALVGETSVRVREVTPVLNDSEAVSSMSEDRIYKISRDLLPAKSYSVFIKDQEKGDLKRLKSYAADGVSNPQFFLDSFCDAHYCAPGTVKVYESWYY